MTIKLFQAPEAQHYTELKDHQLFPGLEIHEPTAMFWEELRVVKIGPVMLQETDPAESMPGTIQGDFCIPVGTSFIAVIQ